jgi:hypothetical protein
MTYKQLLEILQDAPPAILEQTATVFLNENDEYILIDSICFTGDETNVLDEGHLVLNANF